MQNNNELQHTGVLGMRWGHRKTMSKSSDTKKTEGPVKKKADVKSMSDDELKKIVNRMQLEKQYSTLAPKRMSAGKQFAQNMLKAGKTLADVSNTGLTLYNNAGKIKAILKEVPKK